VHLQGYRPPIGAVSLNRTKWLPRLARHSLLVNAVLALSACGVFRGAPAPVISISQEKEDLAIYLGGDVLKKSYSSNDADRNGMSATAWRDAVIAARLQITDLNYQAFKNELYAETSGINLGTNLAALGVSGAAAVASAGTAQALAAASTGILGAGTAFNKDTLYEKTLPAIFAQMEANRTAVLLAMRKSQQNDAGKYPLSLALSDLSAYERAGTLESAIQALTTTATDQADSNKKEIAKITGLTVLPVDVESRKEKFSDIVFALVTKGDKTSLEQLDKVAQAIGAQPDKDPKTEAGNILVELDKQASGDKAAQAMSDLCKKLNSITGQGC
jgi:hypothetical protein